MSSPCDKCTRVPDPDACDNKRCPDWRPDFMDRWDKTCLHIFRLLNKKKDEDSGELPERRVAGSRYYHRAGFHV